MVVLGLKAVATSRQRGDSPALRRPLLLREPPLTARRRGGRAMTSARSRTSEDRMSGLKVERDPEPEQVTWAP